MLFFHDLLTMMQMDADLPQAMNLSYAKLRESAIQEEGRQWRDRLLNYVTVPGLDI